MSLMGHEFMKTDGDALKSRSTSLVCITFGNHSCTWLFFCCVFFAVFLRCFLSFCFEIVLCEGVCLFDFCILEEGLWGFFFEVYVFVWVLFLSLFVSLYCVLFFVVCPKMVQKMKVISSVKFREGGKRGGRRRGEKQWFEVSNSSFRSTEVIH